MLDLDRMGERLSGPPPVRFLARHGNQIGRAVIWALAVLAFLSALGFAISLAALLGKAAGGSRRS